VKRLLLLMLVSISPWLAAEKTAYVTDNLSTAVRSGATNEYRILFYVPAGSQVTVLDDAADNGFIKVRDDRGREGWTLERFIVDTKGARIRLQEVEAQLAEALQTIETMKKQHEGEMSAVQDRLNNANEIVRKSASFQQQISELQTENTTLEQQNRMMADRFQQEVLFAGAIVVLGGMVIGAFLGRMSRKKRSNWN